MFGNLGIGEILIIAAVALILLGPERFPEYAKIAMRAYRDFRGYFEDIKREMREELRPVQRELNALGRYEPEQYIDKLASAVTSVTEESEKTGEPAAPSEQPADGQGEAASAESPPEPERQD